MKVLVINCGSSSLKYQLIKTDDKSVEAKGAFERIGETGSFFSHTNNSKKIDDEKMPCKSHRDAVAKMFSLLIDKEFGAIKDLHEIEAIGHRVVHGGEKYRASTLVTPSVIENVEALSNLAPLHNPANLIGINECLKVLPDVPSVMVFDTAFHKDLPKSAYLYAIPLENYTNHKIRRYGFHGTSFSYVSKIAAQMSGKPIEKLKMIICHIGNGCSVAAVNGGKCVEVSTGLTPLEGLVMGTRSGDIDPGVHEMLCKIHGFDIKQCTAYLNKKSGLLGLSGSLGVSDMRDLMDKRTTSEEAKTALDCFIHRVTKYVGGYIAVLGGVDAVVWTGGIGNNNEYIREQVMQHFEYMGAIIDKAKNNKLNGFPGGKNLTQDISASGAKVKTFVVNTNEELEIAIETENVIKPKKQ